MRSSSAAGPVTTQAKASPAKRAGEASPARTNVPSRNTRRWLQVAFNAPLSYLAWGALSALGRPGIDLSLLFPALVGVMIYGAVAAKSTRQAALRAALWGIGGATPIAIGGQSWGWPVPVGMTIAGAFFYILPLGLLARWASRRAPLGYAVLLVGVVWSLYTWLLHALEVPLACIAQALVVTTPSLLGGARFVGTSIVEGLLTATVFAVAVSLVQSRGDRAKTRAHRATGPVLVGLACLVVLSGLARISAPGADGQLRVGIAQVNAGAEYHGSRLEIPAMQRAFDRQLQGLLNQLGDVQLVTLTETFDGRYNLMLPDLLDAWSLRAKKRSQAYLVTSYLSEKDGRKSNAAGLIDARGKLTGIHRKVVLAPYGERGLAAGGMYQPLPLFGSAAVGVMICQESMSGRATRALAEAGASLLVATSSDISFGSSLVPFEHLAATRLRAIEYGRSIIWASNAGPSGVIDRWGRSPGLGPFRQAVAVKANLSLHQDTTPYSKLGRVWLVLLLLALGALLWLVRSQTPPDFPETETRSPARLASALVGISSFVLVVSAMPALVELQRGSSARALAAIADLWSGQARLPLQGNLERFYTNEGQSDSGAVALFLSYYGQELVPEQVAPATKGGIEGVKELLKQRYGLETRMIHLGESLPSTAVLVELSNGSFGVLASPTGQQGWLFSPGKRTLGTLSGEQRRELEGRPALVPVYGGP